MTDVGTPGVNVGSDDDSVGVNVLGIGVSQERDIDPDELQEAEDD
jgi:hypothetical protein